MNVSYLSQMTECHIQSEFIHPHDEKLHLSLDCLYILFDFEREIDIIQKCQE